MSALRRFALLTLVLVLSAAAQVSATAHAPQDKFTFEAASIKPAPPDDGRNMVHVSGGPGERDPGQFTATNITLRWLLGEAYREPYSIIGPNWLDEAHYDLIAKVPPGTTKDQFELMVRSLLEERAALKAHHETREFPAYDLVIAKGGPKLAEAHQESQMPPAVPPGEQKLDAEGFPQLNRPGLVSYHSTSHGVPMARMVGKAQNMSGLVEWLRASTRTYVTDKTGLQGKYDFKLEYGEDVLTAAPSANGLASPPAPNIFSAIKSLGLVLEKSKASLDVLVIDHIDKVLQPN